MILDRLVAETVAFHDTGAKVFDQHIGFRDEILRDFLTAIASEVDPNGRFVAVKRQEVGRIAFDLGRFVMTDVVAMRRILNLDDLRAEDPRIAAEEASDRAPEPASAGLAPTARDMACE